MNKDILTLIDEKYNDFSKSQRLIADYIKTNFEKTAYMTAGSLSAKIGISEATMVRFASVLGFDGYPSFQKMLQKNVKNKLTSMQRMELALEKIGSHDLLQEVLKSDISAIEKTLSQTDKSNFEKAVSAISSGKKIFITGVRSAAALAEFAGFYLNLIFENVRVIKTTGGDGLFEQLLSVSEGDVIIGISFPRYSKNTVKALEYAKKNGATVIGITDSEYSPVAKTSHISLIAESETTSFVDSLTAPFSLINALIVAVVMNNRDIVSHNFEKLEQIWDEYEVYDKK